MRFAHPLVLEASVIAVIVVLAARFFVRRAPVYHYPLAGTLAGAAMASRHPYRIVFFIVRLATLLLLAFLLGKPQRVDVKSKVTVKGISIVVVLDVSGSMQLQDCSDDDRSRFNVAQDEAIRFIRARTNDELGLVIFGRDALSRCPLTSDKKALTTIVKETKIGDVNPDGTVLSRGIVAAANRLKMSKAKSKVMIVLTDGEPTPEDIDPKVAIDIARQLGIKIYTIGIGSDEERIIAHPVFGMVVMPKVNRDLLSKMAHDTGGQFFLARDEHEMRTIYDTIDKLEKVEYEAPLYTKYHTIFMPFVWILLVMIGSEILLASTLWFHV